MQIWSRKFNNSEIEYIYQHPSSGPGNDKLDSEIAELRSEIELLGGAFDSYTSTDSEWSNEISREISAIQSELQRISDNQDILMKILKKDIKKLKENSKEVYIYLVGYSKSIKY